MKKYRVNTKELEYFKEGEIITQSGGSYRSDAGYRLDKKLIDAMPLWFEKVDDDWHWLGMFNVKNREEFWSIYHGLRIIHMENNSGEIAPMMRLYNSCCKTEDEAEFVFKHLEAARDLADLLKKFNDGWRPDFEGVDMKYTPTHIPAKREIYLHPTQTHQILDDKFYPKNEEVWEQVKAELGEEKIILALWPEIIWRKRG